ncbi:MAG: 6-bladed beta-propeller [Prolixibacteraceae bacterium]
MTHQLFKIYILAVFVLGMANCDKQRKHLKEAEGQKSTVVIFDLKDLEKTTDVKLSELGIIDIEYVPLETNKNSMIGEIYDLQVDDHSILINSAGKIKKYSINGNYITQIGREGKGEGEYHFGKDFSCDKNSRVYILSMHEDKIYIYSPEGKFLNTVPCPRTSTKLCCLEHNILCFSENPYGSVENSFDIINYDGKILKSFPNKFKFNAGKFKGLLFNECASFMSEGHLYVKEVSSDTIFIYNDMDLVPAFILDHGGKSIPPEKRHWNSFEEFMKTASKHISIRRLLKFGEYIYYGFTLDGNGYIFIGSVNGRFQFVANLKQGLINDLDGGPNIWFETIKNDQTMISWINAYELKAYVASDAFKKSMPKYPEKKKELEKLANTLSENDNPVLMLVKVKK